MFYLKTKYFARWARREGVTDSALCGAIREFENGLYDADLGNHLYKKRIALEGRGKRGGARTVLFYQREAKLVFCFGFAKNVTEDLAEIDKKSLGQLADQLLEFNPPDLERYIRSGALIKIEGREE